MISAVNLAGNELVRGKRCQVPKEVLQEMREAARADYAGLYVVVVGDQLAPTMGRSQGMLPDVPTTIDSML
jgi:hypothetical protein